MKTSLALGVALGLLAAHAFASAPRKYEPPPKPALEYTFAAKGNVYFGNSGPDGGHFIEAVPGGWVCHGCVRCVP